MHDPFLPLRCLLRTIERSWLGRARMLRLQRCRQIGVVFDHDRYHSIRDLLLYGD